MPTINADSATTTAAINATNTADGRAIEGTSQSGQAIYGESHDQAGVVGVSEKFVGVWGEGRGEHPGVFGKSQKWQGVHGESIDQVGVIGVSEKFVGVWGETKADGHPGVLGIGAGNAGVVGVSEKFVGVWGEGRGDHPGVFGKSTKWQGVHGESTDQVGVIGVSEKFVGVWAETKAVNHPALVAKAATAAVFDGNVHVNGRLRVGGIDLALVVSDLASKVGVLESRVKHLESRAGVTAAPPATSAFLQIDVDHSSKRYLLSGGGFPANSPVSVTVVRAGQLHEQVNDRVTDSLGWFNYESSMNCGEGNVTYRFVAKAGGKEASSDLTCTPSV